MYEKVSNTVENLNCFLENYQIFQDICPSSTALLKFVNKEKPEHFKKDVNTKKQMKWGSKVLIALHAILVAKKNLGLQGVMIEVNFQ